MSIFTFFSLNFPLPPRYATRGLLSSPEKVDGDWWKGVEEERRELVQAVEHQRVLPDEDGEHQRSHAEDVVSLVASY